MTLENNFNYNQSTVDFSESFHPIKWLQSVGAFLNTDSDKDEPHLCPQGKKSVQTTVLTII